MQVNLYQTFSNVIIANFTLNLNKLRFQSLKPRPRLHKLHLLVSQLHVGLHEQRGIRRALLDAPERRRRARRVRGTARRGRPGAQELPAGDEKNSSHGGQARLHLDQHLDQVG